MRKIKIQNMKKLILAFLITFIAFSANAQNGKNIRLSLGGELGTATGNLNVFYSLAVGATVQADIAIDKNATFTLNAGIIQLTGKKINNNQKYRSEATIPLLVGVKYYFTPIVYGSAQLGTTVFTNGPYDGSHFTYVPGIGFKLDKNIDLLIKYTGLSNAGGIFGARIAYIF